MKLVVASTDPNAAKLAQTNGARAVLVARSLEQLNKAQQRLDQAALQMSDEQKSRIWTCGVDVKTNVVVITVPPNDPQAQIDVQDFLRTGQCQFKMGSVEELHGDDRSRPIPFAAAMKYRSGVAIVPWAFQSPAAS